MRIRTLVTLALSYRKSCHALTVPSGNSVLSLPNSPFNSTDSLSISASSIVNTPNNFRCTTEFLRRGYQPMNSVAFYINALVVMYDLSFLGQQSTLPDWRSWELEDYGVRVAAKTTQIRYAVWGLLQVVQRAAEHGFWPTASLMYWDGKLVGQINVGYRRGVSSSNATYSASNATAALRNLALNTTTADSITDLGANRFEYTVTPKGRATTVNHLFQTVFSVLAYSAEIGPSATFQRWVSDGLSFVPERDSKGNSLMVYGNLIKAMTFVATTAVEANYFNEVEIAVMKNGVRIGMGWLRNPSGVESL